MDNAYDMGRKRGQEESRKEIEQLRKENEWLLEQCISLETTVYDYGMDKPQVYAKEGILKQMQQVLKER